MKPALHRNVAGASNTLLLLVSIYPSLTKMEKKVADVVQLNPEETILLTVTDLAEKADVSETTVIRFCRRLGFRGFQEFKLAIAQNMANIPSGIDGHIEDSDDPTAIAQKVTLKNKQVLQDTADFIQADIFNLAVDTLINAKKILTVGVGSSGVTALDAQYRFMRLGLNVEGQRDPHIFAMMASLIGKGDVAFGISSSGSTKDVIETMAIAKDNGARVICLTSHAKSPITNYADIVLLVPSRESPLQGGELSTKIGQIHMIDLLSQLILIKNKAVSLDSIQKTSNAVADKLY